VTRIAVLGLTEATGGNGLGIGLADYTTVDVVDRIDLKTIYMNSITSTLAEKSRIPIVLPTDLEAVQATVATCWSAEDALTRMCVIRSTLHLDEILVSEVLLPELRASGRAEDIGPLFELVFDAEGRLLSRAYGSEEGALAAA
jgi:hypothetical protein